MCELGNIFQSSCLFLTCRCLKHIYTYILIIALSIANTATCKEITECFTLPIKYQDKGPVITKIYQRSQIPAKIEVVLRCSSLQHFKIKSITYTFPTVNYCTSTEQTIVDENSVTLTTYDCCSNMKEESVCPLNIIAPDPKVLSLVDRLNEQCTNKTEYCPVFLERQKVDDSCPIQHNECKKEKCYSRWVTVDYECQGEGWTVLEIVGLSVGLGLAALIIVIIIIRKLASDRELRRRDSFSPGSRRHSFGRSDSAESTNHHSKNYHRPKTQPPPPPHNASAACSVEMSPMFQDKRRNYNNNSPKPNAPPLIIRGSDESGSDNESEKVRY